MSFCFVVFVVFFVIPRAIKTEEDKNEINIVVKRYHI